MKSSKHFTLLPHHRFTPSPGLQTLDSTLLMPLCLLLMLTSCTEPPRPAQTPAKPPIAVQTITVQAQDVSQFYTATGTVHAHTESQLSSLIMARVRSINVQAGDRVRSGQILISLDSQEPDAGFQKAQATRAEAQSTIAEADSAVAQAKANLDLANVTADRMNDLFAKRSISKQEMDETTAKLKTAQAAYEMARARREQLNSRIAQNDASIQEAQTTRNYTVIRAPFAGIVTARNIEPGAIAVPGALLLSIETGTGYRMHAAVEQSHLAQVHQNDNVTVFIDSLQQEIPGRVAEISPVSDSNSHTYTVKIDLLLNAAVHAGEFGHVSFLSGSKQAITIPASAVIENGQLQSIFVNDHGLARLRLITLGDKRVGQAEVLSGLDKDDRIINPIPAGLQDGDRVEEAK